MTYPMLVNWIDVKIVNKDRVVFIDRLAKDSYTLDCYTAWFASRLDGKTNPYEIDRGLSDEDVDELLNELDDMDLLRNRRILLSDFAEIYLSCWIPRTTTAFRAVAFIINQFLIYSWLPVLVISIFCFFNSHMQIKKEYMIIGDILGLIIGAIFHEFSHMFACLAYGGRVFELGIFFNCLFPGAYTLIDTSDIKRRVHRVQVNSAGIESNFLLAGISLFLVSCSEMLSGIFWGIAVINVVLALFNLLLVDGLDGMAIIEELLGIDNLSDKAKMIRKSKVRKRKLAGKGLTVKLSVAVCYVVSVVKIAIPIIIVINIIEITEAVLCFL